MIGRALAIVLAACAALSLQACGSKAAKTGLGNEAKIAHVAGGVFGGVVACGAPSAAPQTHGQRFCQGSGAIPVSVVRSFDGTPIDAGIALPAAKVKGDYPVVVVMPGITGTKLLGSNPQVQRWLRLGYAVMSITPRGFGASCGPTAVASEGVDGCRNGTVHLDDTRYEAHDVQYLLGLLADDGVIDPVRIGATGNSYGGGIALELGALRDRVQAVDGQYQPWRSPHGKAMRIAATAPEWSWSDLLAAFEPNGSTLDYAAASPYAGPSGTLPYGVQKKQWAERLLAGVQGSGRLPQDDASSFKALVDAGTTGGPYASGYAASQVRAYATNSAGGVLMDRAPAPAILSNGWNDDLFPVDETLRYYNAVRAKFPSAPISLMALDWGHPIRGGLAPPTVPVATVLQAEQAWFAHYVMHATAARTPARAAGGVTLVTSACSGQRQAAGQLYSFPNWASVAPGEVRLTTATPQTVSPNTSPNYSFEHDGDSVCTTAPSANTSGAADYTFPAARAGGYIVAGSPTIVATLAVSGGDDELVGRLYDVAPGGQERLISRGVYRPGAAGTRQHVFQLHPQAWVDAAGHALKLELLGRDQPYLQASKGQTPITVRSIDVRIPVGERPGSAGGQVSAPAPRVLPAGYTVARDLDPRAVAGTRSRGR